jgi:hypothetical protein
VVPSRRPYQFILKVTFVSTVAYLVAGLFAYQLITKRFYVGDDAIFAGFLRSEADPVLWRHVMTWQFPVLVARGLLISLALLPFRAALSSFTLRTRVLSLFGLFFVLLHMAAAAPSPSNLEGIVYMRPEFIDIGPFLLTQPEMVFQSLLFALGTGIWACARPERPSPATLEQHDGAP